MSDWPTPEQYAAARPFPHAVWEPFAREHAEAIADEFPIGGQTWQEHWHHFASPVEEKWQMSDPARFGPETRRVVDLMLAPVWVREVERVTGLDGLRGSTFGGGYHLIRPGGFLGMHVDSLHDPDGEHWETSWYRCVNLLLFLTDNNHWSADLVLANVGGLGRGGGPDETRVQPKPGRAVMFNTAHDTLHGHPHPLGDADRDRQSLAVYYYRETPPPGYRGDQATTFVKAR